MTCVVNSSLALDENPVSTNAVSAFVLPHTTPALLCCFSCQKVALSRVLRIVCLLIRVRRVALFPGRRSGGPRRRQQRVHPAGAAV